MLARAARLGTGVSQSGPGWCLTTPCSVTGEERQEGAEQLLVGTDRAIEVLHDITAAEGDLLLLVEGPLILLLVQATLRWCLVQQSEPPPEPRAQPSTMACLGVVFEDGCVHVSLGVQVFEDHLVEVDYLLTLLRKKKEADVQILW
jgi:hypothetical protein